MESHRGYRNSRKKISSRRGSEPKESESKRKDRTQARVTSESPPHESSPRVVLLRPTQAPQVTTSSAITTGSVSPENSTPTPEALSQPNRVTSSPVPSITSQKPVKTNHEEVVIKKSQTPERSMRLIDLNTWSFMEHPAGDYMMDDSCVFKVVSVVGTQSSGKSSLMNLLAGHEVFKIHDPGSNCLQHMTEGVQLYVTHERLFLLDSQPVLSPSILDELISNSSIQTHICSSDVLEPDAIFISSVQIVTFLLSVSDCLVIAADWNFDVHLVKLLSTALMMIGATALKPNIIWFMENKVAPTETKDILECLESFLGRGSITLINGDKEQLLTRVLRTNTGRNLTPVEGSVRSPTNNQFSEKNWFTSAQRFWDNSIKKSNLYTDYARLIK